MANYPLDYQGSRINALLDKIDQLGAATDQAAGTMSAADKGKLNGMEAGAQANVIEKVKINGTKLEPESKAVNITVDSEPTSNSPNPVSSGGVKAAIANFITNSVNDLVNYYLKSETYTKAEVQALIGAINQFHYEVYPDLEAVTSPANNVLYLIGPTGSGSDKYEEYVWPNAQQGFVLIGTTSIDLSGYVTTTALNTALANYTTTADLTTLLAAKADIADLEDGTAVPLMSETLRAWADQKALAKEDTYSDKVRTSGGDIPIETAEGCKIRSIRPSADFTMKFFFNGSYNMLNAAKWGNTNSQPMVGGVLTGGCYFLVPKLTLGTFGTADENNGLLFTLADGTNINPTVYFKALGSSAPSSLTDGTAVTPTSVSYDGKTYYSYECSGPGWFILTYPSGKTLDNICAHIAWEDWYDKYVGLDENPATNPEAAVGVLMVESFLALIHSDKKLRYIDEEHLDYVEFADTSAIGHHNVDLKVTVASDWTTTQDGDNYTHTASVGSAMKSGGAAILLDGTELEVTGTQVSFTDQNASVSGDKLTIKYERASEDVITRAYTDSVFSGSNIGTSTGKLSINDCSIEAQVGASGTAAITSLYAINVVDKLGLIAQVDFQELLNTVDDQNSEIDDLNRALMEEMAKDPDEKYGQPRILWGNGTPAEATIPTNWKQFLDGGYNWIGKPAFVGQIYINTAVSTGGTYIGYKTSGSLLEWRTIVG